jgi:hypothetical protein
MRAPPKKKTKQTIRKEKTNRPRIVANKCVKKDFISTPYFED